VRYGGNMKKYMLVVLLVILAACAPAPESTPTLTPTNTPEPTATPTNTPTPTLPPTLTLTPTPEYCPVNESSIASKEIGDIMTRFTAQTNKIGSLSNSEYTEVITEMMRIQHDLVNVSIPICLERSKELLLAAMQYTIEGMTYYAGNAITQGNAKMTSASAYLNLFIDEMNRMTECTPNCQP